MPYELQGLDPSIFNVTLLTHCFVFLHLLWISTRVKAEISHAVREVIIPKMEFEPKVAAQEYRMAKDQVVPNCPRADDHDEKRKREDRMRAPAMPLRVSASDHKREREREDAQQRRICKCSDPPKHTPEYPVPALAVLSDL